MQYIRFLFYLFIAWEKKTKNFLNCVNLSSWLLHCLFGCLCVIHLRATVLSIQFATTENSSFFIVVPKKILFFFWEKKKNNKKCIQIKFFWCKIYPWIFINTSIDIIIDIQYSLCPFHECLSLYETIPYIYERNRFVRNSQHNNYNPHAKDFFDLKSSTFWSFLSLIDRFRI